MAIDLPASEALEVPETVAGVPLVGGGGVLTGWTFKEPTNLTGNEWTLRDGERANAPILGTRTLAVNESVTDPLPQPGVLFRRGLFLDVQAGTVEGAVYVVLAHRIPADQWAALIGDA